MDIERLKELREEVFEDYKAYMVKNLKDEDGKVYPSTVPLDECSPIGKDLLKLIDEAIARQSVKSEEVAEQNNKKNRTVEEAAISKTETTGCEWCEKTGKYAGFAYATFFEQTAPDEEYEISVECNYCPNCGRKLN